MIQWQNFNSELQSTSICHYYMQKGQQCYEIASKGEEDKPCALCRFVHVIKFQKMYWVWYGCCATLINLLLLIFANSGMTIQARRSFHKKATSLATNETSEAANLIRSFTEPEVTAKQAQICDFSLVGEEFHYDSKKNFDLSNDLSGSSSASSTNESSCK